MSLLGDLDKGAVGELEEGTSVLHSHLLQHEAGKALRAGARAHLKKQAPHLQAQQVREELASFSTTVCEAVAKEDCDMLALEDMKMNLPRSWMPSRRWQARRRRRRPVGMARSHLSRVRACACLSTCECVLMVGRSVLVRASEYVSAHARA